MRPSKVSLVGTGPSAWLPLDAYPDADLAGLFLRFSSTGSATLEVTPDDIQDPAVTPLAFALGAPWTAVTANLSGALQYSVKAIRINASANAGTITLTVMTSGGM